MGTQQGCALVPVLNSLPNNSMLCYHPIQRFHCPAVIPNTHIPGLKNTLRVGVVLKACCPRVKQI